MSFITLVPKKGDGKSSRIVRRTHSHSAPIKTFFSLHCCGEIAAHISTATEETARDKCLGAILMSSRVFSFKLTIFYARAFSFFLARPPTSSGTVVSWKIDEISDSHTLLTCNHQQQTPAKKVCETRRKKSQTMVGKIKK